MTFCKELEYQKLQQIQKRKWSNIRLMNLESIFLSNAWIIRNFHDAMRNSSMCHQNVNFWLIRSHGTQMSEITCVTSVWLEPGTWGLWVCMMLSVLSNPAYSWSWPILIKFDVPESISSLVNRDGWGRGGRIGHHRDLYPTVCILRQKQWQINTLAQIFLSILEVPPMVWRGWQVHHAGNWVQTKYLDLRKLKIIGSSRPCI